MAKAIKEEKEKSEKKPDAKGGTKGSCGCGCDLPFRKK
jgi:hypothetical protein